jgi:hypothetical protein
VSLFGTFLLFSFLGFSNWYGYGWNLTFFTKLMLLFATLSAFIYCYGFTFLPDTFTYNGSTAIFLSTTYIFAIMLIHLKSTKTENGGKEKYLKTDFLIKNMFQIGAFESEASLNGDEHKNDHPSLEKVMEATARENEEY